jgi:hypothetical protein
MTAISLVEVGKGGRPILERAANRDGMTLRRETEVKPREKWA